MTCLIFLLPLLTVVIQITSIFIYLIFVSSKAHGVSLAGNSSVDVIIMCDSQEPHKLLQPVDKTLKAMAVEFAEYQV
jgi:hypothetical protein